MPFYEYKCATCKSQFEELINLSSRDAEEAALVCPNCGAKGPERIISSFATGQASAKPSAPPCAEQCPRGG
jgi:putative FmdB family regulatory protein